MCTGAEIAMISVAASAAGTGLQGTSHSDTQKEIREAQAATDEANDQLQRQSQQEVLETTDDFSRERFDDVQAEQTGNIKKTFKDSLAEGLPGQFSSGDLSSNTQRLLSDETTKNRGDTDRFASALANLRGFSQGLTDSNRGIQRAGENIQLNQTAQSGNSAVLPLTIQGAVNNSGNPFADILVAGGAAGAQAAGTQGTVKTGGGGSITGGVPSPGRKPSFKVV